MDYVDLYLIHFPLAWEFTTLELNPKAPGLDEHGIMKRAKVPLIDTWRAMEVCNE
jgi:diketogulonate reductase-like aldo/keto reductase